MIRLRVETQKQKLLNNVAATERLYNVTCCTVRECWSVGVSKTIPYCDGLFCSETSVNSTGISVEVADFNFCK